MAQEDASMQQLLNERPCLCKCAASPSLGHILRLLVPALYLQVREAAKDGDPRSHRQRLCSLC
jgi:hypothetical protein